jgi:hypothetical protein
MNVFLFPLICADFCTLIYADVEKKSALIRDVFCA